MQGFMAPKQLGDELINLKIYILKKNKIKKPQDLKLIYEMTTQDGGNAWNAFESNKKAASLIGGIATILFSLMHSS